MRITILALTLLTTMQATAQDASPSQLAPVESFSLPWEIDRDFGATNGDATIMRITPLYHVKVNEDWRITNLDLVSIADAPGGVAGRPGNPNTTLGDRAFGLGDWAHVSLLTPEASSPILGVGAIISVPTATDPVLGSGKWSAGPALRLTYRTERWNLGSVFGQLWSFAGQSDRHDVSQLMIRGAIRYQLPEKWFLVSSPIVTANWNASGSQRWLVPLGGGIGRTFRVNKSPWSWSIQGYHYSVRPTSAPEWAVRFAIISGIPKL